MVSEPGPEGLKLGLLWEKHLLVDTKVDRNEAELMEDIDGDGVPEFIVNSSEQGDFVAGWQFTSEIREVSIPKAIA